MTTLQDHLNRLLIMNTAIMRAAVISTDGILLARTYGQNLFLVDLPELVTFAEYFDNRDSAQNGVRLELILYPLVRVERTFMSGRCRECGFVAVRTDRVIIIAVYDGNFREYNLTLALLRNLAETLEETNILA